MKINSLKIILSFFLILPLLNMTKLNSIEASGVSIKDVPKSSFAHDAIMDLVERQVIFGYGEGTFKPGATVTRGQFATMLARALNLPEANSNFKDLSKSKSLYDGVSKAAKAGLIKGNNGYVYPDKPVSRADIAVMIDRAMNMKGKFNETIELNLFFTDANKIPGYAQESVRKMTRYGIIQGKNNQFLPNAFADRATSSVFVFRALNLIEGKTSIPDMPKPPILKNYTEMTIAELKATYPQHNHVIVHRVWKPEAKILVKDMIEEYYKEIHTPIDQGGIKEYAHKWDPDKWFNFHLPGIIAFYKHVYSDGIYGYPMVEAIAYNGKAFKDSALMDQDFPTFDSLSYKTMPSQPKEAGQFLIDIRYFDNDYVIYRHEDVKWDILADNPVRIDHPYPNGDEYIVDLYGALKYATGVTMAKGGLEIAYGGKKITLTNGSKQAIANGKTVTLAHEVKFKNGRAYGPIREIVGHIGLDSREVHYSKRIEIANFPLEKDATWLK